MKYENHYEYLHNHLMKFFDDVLGKEHYYNDGCIAAHGDKVRQYYSFWEKNGIHRYHGAAIYLLMRVAFFDDVYPVSKDKIKPEQWVVNNYTKYKHLLPDVD